MPLTLAFSISCYSIRVDRRYGWSYQTMILNRRRRTPKGAEACREFARAHKVPLASVSFDHHWQQFHFCNN